MFHDRVLVQFAEACAAGYLECLTDFQLQIEHALDLQGRSRVLVVDASVRALAPFTVTEARPEADRSVSTHALSPAAVLETCLRVLGTAPPMEILAIRGESFELGDPLGEAAARHLEAALSWFGGWLAGP